MKLDLAKLFFFSFIFCVFLFSFFVFFFKGGSIEDASPLNTHCHQGASEN